MDVIAASQKKYMKLIIVQERESEKFNSLIQTLSNLMCSLPPQNFLNTTFFDIMIINLQKPDLQIEKAAQAFLHLEKYALLLHHQPWKGEFRTLRKYNGFYKTQVEAHLLGADEILQLIGFHTVDKSLLEVKHILPCDQLLSIAFQCLLANIEFSVISEAYNTLHPSVRLDFAYYHLRIGGKPHDVALLYGVDGKKQAHSPDIKMRIYGVPGNLQTSMLLEEKMLFDDGSVAHSESSNYYDQVGYPLKTEANSNNENTHSLSLAIEGDLKKKKKIYKHYSKSSSPSIKGIGMLTGEGVPYLGRGASFEGDAPSSPWSSKLVRETTFGEVEGFSEFPQANSGKSLEDAATFVCGNMLTAKHDLKTIKKSDGLYLKKMPDIDHERSWSCKFCTYRNPVHAIICGMCAKSRHAEELASPDGDVWICKNCTYRNSFSFKKCEICECPQFYQYQQTTV